MNLNLPFGEGRKQETRERNYPKVTLNGNLIVVGVFSTFPFIVVMYHFHEPCACVWATLILADDVRKIPEFIFTVLLCRTVEKYELKAIYFCMSESIERQYCDKQQC